MSKWNDGLNKAKANKDDEFYTRMADIEAELINYDFSDKVVYCNCDTAESNFVKYFSKEGKCKKLLYSGLGCAGTSDGLFEHELDYLEQADVVVTNPPFSKLRDFLNLLLEHDKDFVIIGPLTLIKNKDTREAFVSGKIHAGFNTKKGIKFSTPHAEETLKGSATLWYTTLPVSSKKMTDFVRYDPNKAFFTNEGVLFIKKVSEIPCDFSGVMAVPLTYLPSMDYNRFRITGIASSPYVNGKQTFGRLLIQSIVPKTKPHTVCSAERFLGEWTDEDFEKNENLE